MTQVPDLLTQLLAAETAVWEALRSGDAAADAAALSDGFLGVYPDGMFGKADHVRQLMAGATVASYGLDQARAMALGPTHGLLAYRATYHRPGIGEAEAMYVSSIWEGHDGNWKNVFSQDTPVVPGQVLP